MDLYNEGDIKIDYNKFRESISITFKDEFVHLSRASFLLLLTIGDIKEEYVKIKSFQRGSVIEIIKTFGNVTVNYNISSTRGFCGQILLSDEDFNNILSKKDIILEKLTLASNRKDATARRNLFLKRRLSLDETSSSDHFSGAQTLDTQLTIA